MYRLEFARDVLDWERVVLETSASFWKLIEKRRGQPTISLKELKAGLKKR